MKVVIGIGVFILAIGLAGYSHPTHAACVFADGDELSNSHLELIKKASDRIESKFGSMRSQPIIYFFDLEGGFWQRKLNPYGSTIHLGYRTCVAIGPYGQNIDVVAHELMHAEIEERAGFWTRATKIPDWFEEGLVMQVDLRERYNLPVGHPTKYVTELFSRRKFYVSSPDGVLTQNYAAAKAEVGAWLSQASAKGVYENLSEIKEGTSFDSIWQNSR